MAKKEIFSFDVIIVLAILIGFIIPNFSFYIYKYLVITIIVAMFLNFLKLNLRESFEAKVIFLWIFSNILILPAIAYLLSFFIDNSELKLGILLVSLAPAAIMSPVYASLIGGNKLQATAISVLSNLLSIISIPLLLFIYTGKHITINYSTLMLNIAYIILLPFIIALIIKRIDVIKTNILKYHDVTLKFLLFISLYAIIGENSKSLLDRNIIFLIMIVFIFTIISFSLGYLFSKFAGLKRPEKNTLTLCTGIRNTSLMIGIIASSFTAGAALPTIIYVITHQVINTLLVRLDRKGII